ncbi:unnamed protein product [Rotaria socialis]
MKRTRSISLVPYPPRVRRVSRYELQKLFPKYRSSRVSSQQSFDINLQSSQAKNWSLSFNESNFIHQEHPHSNEKRESVSKKLKLRRRNQSKSYEIGRNQSKSYQIGRNRSKSNEIGRNHRNQHKSWISLEISAKSWKSSENKRD